jgi:nitroreductase
MGCEVRVPFAVIGRAVREEVGRAEGAEFAKALIHSRQNVSPRRLDEPGPSAQQIEEILGAAAAAPDRGMLMPWRFVIVPLAQRSRLAEVFALALADRDPNATAAQIENAREKAHRAPFLLVAIARLSQRGVRQDAMPSQVDHGHASVDAEVGDAERLVSFGCAIQNIVLSAHAAGFGTGITSGQALASPRMRALLSLLPHEQAVCCINIGTVMRHKAKRLRPAVSEYVSELK